MTESDKFLSEEDRVKLYPIAQRAIQFAGVERGSRSPNDNTAKILIILRKISKSGKITHRQRMSIQHMLDEGTALILLDPEDSSEVVDINKGCNMFVPTSLRSAVIQITREVLEILIRKGKNPSELTLEGLEEQLALNETFPYLKIMELREKLFLLERDLLSATEGVSPIRGSHLNGGSYSDVLTNIPIKEYSEALIKALKLEDLEWIAGAQGVETSHILNTFLIDLNLKIRKRNPYMPNDQFVFPYQNFTEVLEEFQLGEESALENSTIKKDRKQALSVYHEFCGTLSEREIIWCFLSASLYKHRDLGIESFEEVCSSLSFIKNKALEVGAEPEIMAVAINNNPKMTSVFLTGLKDVNDSKTQFLLSAPDMSKNLPPLNGYKVNKTPLAELQSGSNYDLARLSKQALEMATGSNHLYQIYKEKAKVLEKHYSSVIKRGGMDALPESDKKLKLPKPSTGEVLSQLLDGSSRDFHEIFRETKQEQAKTLLLKESLEEAELYKKFVKVAADDAENLSAAQQRLDSFFRYFSNIVMGFAYYLPNSDSDSEFEYKSKKVMENYNLLPADLQALFKTPLDSIDNVKSIANNRK